MKTLYLECGMGAAGDMLTAALLELHADPQNFIKRLNAVGIPGVSVSAAKSAKCGINGTNVTVLIDGEEEESHDEHEHHHEHSHDHEQSHEHAGDEEHHHHAHTHISDIEHFISHLNVSDKIKNDILSVYKLIAEAESAAHGMPVEQIHFHEVGTMDALADIAAVCMLIDELAPDKILASPVRVGFGHVHCAHGVLPVPAPATAYILQGVPTYSGTVEGELCTPTGAALLKHFADGFGAMPVMKVSKIGYGMGKKDFATANCVRAMIGEAADEAGEVAELCCNIDDMTPEAVGFAIDELFAGGALDVFTIPAGMKKNRPGILLTCICEAEKSEEMAELIFRHTTTIGIRKNICSRYKLGRSVRTVETKFGPVRIKEASGYGVQRAKPEYDDVAEAARKNALSWSDAYQQIIKEYKDKK